MGDRVVYFKFLCFYFSGCFISNYLEFPVERNGEFHCLEKGHTVFSERQKKVISSVWT